MRGRWLQSHFHLLQHRMGTAALMPQIFRVLAPWMDFSAVFSAGGHLGSQEEPVLCFAALSVGLIKLISLAKHGLAGI